MRGGTASSPLAIVQLWDSLRLGRDNSCIGVPLGNRVIRLARNLPNAFATRDLAFAS